MSTYQELDAELYHKGHGGRMEKRKVANHTWLMRIENRIAVRLHQTYILMFYPDNRVVLNHGGWDTVTTRDRMNRFLSTYVTSRNNQWFVHVNFRTLSEDQHHSWDEPTYIKAQVPYENGMTISATTGELVNHPDSIPIVLDKQIMQQMNDAYRSLGIARENLDTKVDEGSLTKSDLVYATMVLDRHREHTARLAEHLRQLESGASYTEMAMEEALQRAVKKHAAITLEHRERMREVKGQTRLAVLT